MQQDYVCVSTYGQTLDAQLERLRPEGYDKVLREKASGAQADRRQLLWLLKGLTRNDVVIVTQIDRLAARPLTCSSSSRISWPRAAVQLTG